MHYYQFNIGDYIKHTAHLTLIEDITYRRLLDLYYDTEQPITQNNPLVSRKLRVPQDALETVLSEFFILTEKGYINPRADAEIAEYHEFCARQKANGIKGGRPKKTHGLPTANPSLTQPEPKITLNTNHKPLNKQRGDKSPFVLPDKINPEVWKDWHDYRNTKKGWTAKAKQLSLNTLLKLAEKGHNPKLIIETSIERGWTGLFEPKPIDKPVVRVNVAESKPETDAEKARRKLEEQAAWKRQMENMGVAV